MPPPGDRSAAPCNGRHEHSFLVAILPFIEQAPLYNATNFNVHYTDAPNTTTFGTGVSALKPGSAADDSDMLDRRSAHAERAMDELRKKFGNAAVIRGIAYDGPEETSEE